MHCVMHHGQTGGRKTHKVCQKKHVNFTKSGGEICKSRGGKEKFPEIRAGNVLKQRK